MPSTASLPESSMVEELPSQYGAERFVVLSSLAASSSNMLNTSITATWNLVPK